MSDIPGGGQIVGILIGGALGIFLAKTGLWLKRRRAKRSLLKARARALEQLDAIYPADHPGREVIDSELEGGKR